MKNLLAVDGLENLGKGDPKDEFPGEPKYLEDWRPDAGSVLGITPGVTDNSALLVHDFKPIRYELKVLAKHYLSEAHEFELWCEMTQTYGGSQMRFYMFAYRRLDTIAKCLGEKKMEEAISDIQGKWTKEFEEFYACHNLPAKTCGGEPECPYCSFMCGCHREQSVLCWAEGLGDCQICKLPPPQDFGTCSRCGEPVVGWRCQCCSDPRGWPLEMVHELGGRVMCSHCRRRRGEGDPCQHGASESDSPAPAPSG